MDGRGRWMDSVFIERLWRSLKYECVFLNAFESDREVNDIPNPEISLPPAEHPRLGSTSQQCAARSSAFCPSWWPAPAAGRFEVFALFRFIDALRTNPERAERLTADIIELTPQHGRYGLSQDRRSVT